MFERTRGRSALILAVAAALTLAACSDDGGDESAPDTDVEANGATDETDAVETDETGTETDGSDGTDAVEEAEARAAAAAEEVTALTQQLEETESAAAADAAAAAEELETAAATNQALTADNEALTAEVAEVTTRADEADAQLAAIAALFPFEVESTLAGIELQLEGTYSIKWAEAYCEGFATCGSLPTTSQATFARTPENFLRLQVAGILDAGLFAIDGSLYGITDSLTALPACPDGTQRRARITVTAYSDNVVIEQDLSRDVVRLGSSITVDAPNLPDCPGGLVFYGAELTPLG